MTRVYRPRRRLCRAALPLLLVLGGCSTVRIGLPRPDRNTIKPVVAVSSFDNRSGFAGRWELGSGMADLLVSELVQTERLVVVERRHLDRIVGEIVRQKDRLFRPEGKVDEGRLKNAQYLIRGVINDFSQIGGGGLGLAIRNFLFMGRGHTARVAITLTLVDIETGEIIDSVQCAAKVLAREAFIEGKYKNIAFGGDAFFKTPLGTATARAIRQGMQGILKKMPRRQWEPMIASVAGGQIVLNGGRDRRFRAGTLYAIRAEGRPVTDPSTGDLLSMIPGPVLGTIRVIRVEKSISYAEVVRGGGFERGQRLMPAHLATE